MEIYMKNLGKLDYFSKQLEREGVSMKLTTFEI